MIGAIVAQFAQPVVRGDRDVVGFGEGNGRFLGALHRTGIEGVDVGNGRWQPRRQRRRLLLPNGDKPASHSAGDAGFQSAKLT